MQATALPYLKPPTPRDIKTLAAYITEAALLEHQFMCQYLYAAFSLKKQPDSTCSDAQLEVVRRWASHIYIIARQEMEHLSIANSLLTAIGSPPWFGHDNFPTQSRWYQASAILRNNLALVGPEPCDFPFLMQAFDLPVARRFCCMESPTLEYVPPQDRQNVIDWCFQSPAGGCGCVPQLPAPLRLAHSFVKQADLSPNTVEPGTVQELYAAIASGLQYLNQTLGSKELFSGHQSGQSQIPSEYDIYLFSICDLETALAGVRLITTQGEGIDAPPGYDSHFQNYYDIAVEFQAMRDEDPAFQPALPLPLDPEPEQYTIPTTAEAVAAFTDGYVALLYMLAGYYANYTRTAYGQPPYLLPALEQTVFAPTMTMLIRSLAELIVQLPADQSGAPAGPVFNLSPEVLHRLSTPSDPIFLDINFHIANLEPVKRRLERIIEDDTLPPALKPKFEYVHQNVWRMMANLQFIYENGIYSKFLNLPSCPRPKSCD
jgi:hypothetical protein